MIAWLHARKDLERLWRQPFGLAIWVCIPLLIGGMVALASGGGGGGTKPKVRMFVADADDSFGSRMLVSALQQSGMVTTEAVAADEGRAQLLRGTGSVLLEVPDGFANAVLRRKPTQLHLLTNPSQRILPGIASEMLRMFAEAVFYLQQLLGPEYERVVAGIGDVDRASSTAWSIAFAARGTELTEKLRPLFDPLRIELVDRSPKPADGADAPAGGGGFAIAFWPGILLMALFFSAQGLSEDLWEERRLGTLRRAVASPSGLRPWLLGKLMATAVVAAVVGIVALGAGVVMLGMPARALWLGLPWVAVVGVGMLLMLWPLVCIASSARAANVLSSAVMFPLLMLGGSFFPFESMPAWMARIGRATPNGWLLEQLRAIVGGTPDPLAMLLGVAAIAGLGWLVLAFCERRLCAAVGG